MMSEDHEYNESVDEAIVSASKVTAAVDEVLMNMLKDLRKSGESWCPSILLFQDPSLEDMALKYPISCTIN
jgi:ATP-dependent DNA helicase RecQ